MPWGSILEILMSLENLENETDHGQIREGTWNVKNCQKVMESCDL